MSARAWWGALWVVGTLLLSVAGCRPFEAGRVSVAPTPDDHASLAAREELSGGATTIFDTTPDAFSRPAPGLTREQELLFFVGNSFFNQNWVTAPSSTTARDGLGPLFNSRSCAGCHFKDGRGRPPAFDGEAPTGFLLRLSVPGSDAHGGPLPEPTYGGQLQDGALEGLMAEARVVVAYEETTVTFSDGQTVSLRRPTYRLAQLSRGDLAADARLSPRVANQLIGLGLLEAVPVADIVAQADPDDRDGDGISGRPNYVWDFARGEVALGRFGWKANEPTIAQQTADAFLGDMGITTPLFAAEACTRSIPDCEAITNGGTPEIDPDDFDKVVLYASSLAVPARRDWIGPEVLRGERLFHEAGCAACHTPTLTTAEHPTIAALSNQVIHPYTDLLLHDMGEGLADQRADFLADGREWRTPPLWGLGLIETVNGHTQLLHDGRARNNLEAILWHGGEAQAARDAFAALSAAEREAVLHFLDSQ